MTTPGRRPKQHKDAVDDLVLLEEINEKKIVDTLSNRYNTDLIYTNIGPVLIAINPFKLIVGNYTDAKIREYKGKKSYELAPHVFALASEAYSNMISYRENQCIIITGESGSGKTETSKFIMQFISAVSGNSSEVVRVKERMLSSNPILEGFGNAKTVNNNNSSRFGKYMEILFDGGDPVGGRVTNYLLEKSRVVGAGQGERSFHIFYQVCAGASAAERQAYCIEQADYYYYLSCSGCYSVPGINDVEDFKELNESFRTVGITESERQDILRCISICLWLGNLAFTERKPEVAEVADRQVLEIVAGLLQVGAPQLEAALCTRSIQTGVGSRAEKFTKPNTAVQSDFCRDTLSKAIYSRLFDWLVHKVNVSIKKDGFSGIQIGVLDIYGFEIFQSNSFEQLCINFVNESLQQIFIELTLKAEQDEYAAEGIPWRDIPFHNNKPLCDLIEGKPGLLSICDDCCNTAKTDAMFVNDLKAFFSGNNNIRCGSNDFTIRHYAGSVRYAADGFMTKNKDTLFDDLIQVMQASPLQFVKDHGWADIPISEGQKKRPPTVGAIFRSQVNDLVKALKSCQPHYIRCIKPNHTKKPNEFDRDNVTRQVKYLGLLENVRVRRAGYAHRSTFDRFLRRYALLSKTIWSGRARGSPKDFCVQLCNDLGWVTNKEYALGRTKIFIQEAATLFALEDALERKMDEAILTIQRAYRNYKQKRYYMVVRSNAYELVNGRKERRRGSVSVPYHGDYINAYSNKLIQSLLVMSGAREKLLFADRAIQIQAKGKRSVLGSVFGKTPLHQELPRLILLTDRTLYMVALEVDALTNQVKCNVYLRQPILQLQTIITSTYCDNHLILHFGASLSAPPHQGQQAPPNDLIIRLRHKTELLALLVQESKKLGRNMFDLRFQNEYAMIANAAKKRTVHVKWNKDGMMDSCTDRLVRVQHNIEIQVGSGVTPNQVPVPSKPIDLDAAAAVPGGGRPALKALHDFEANESQGELAFKEGDIIFIVREEEGGWYEGELRGKKGYVPGTYVERVKRTNPAATATTATASRPKFGGAANATTGSTSTATSTAAKSNTNRMFNFTQSSTPTPPPISLPKKKCVWEEHKMDNGETYYYNTETQESTWDRPAELDQPPQQKQPQPPPMPQLQAQPKPVIQSQPQPQPQPSSQPLMSPVSPNLTKNCAMSGCSRARFKGPYCAQHAGGGFGAGATTTSTSSPPSLPTRPTGAGAGSAPAIPARPNRGVAAAAARFTAASSSSSNNSPTPTPATSASSPRPIAARFGSNANQAGPPAIVRNSAAPAMASTTSSSSYNSTVTGAPAGGVAARAAMFKAGGLPMPRQFGGGSTTTTTPAVTAAPVSPRRRSDWQTAIDPASGDRYYYNSVTGETTWEKPKGF